MNTKDFKKMRTELDELLGFPRSTFLRDNLLLLLSLLCTVALYSFYNSAPPATPGHFNPPFEQTGLTILLFSFCIAAFLSGGWVLMRGWTIWQRQIALILLLFPSVFVLATLMWLIKKAMT